MPDKNDKRPQPRIATPQPRSRHSGLGSTEAYVHIRHPEFIEGQEPFKETSRVDMLTGYDPEEGVLSLDQPCEPFADLSCYLLDDFDRTVSGGTWSDAVDGGAYSGPTYWQTGASGPGGCSYAGEAAEVDFQLWSTGPYTGSRHVWSSLGTAAHGWTTNPGCGCGGLDFTFTGWMEREFWTKITVPAHPSDMAGVNVGPWTFFAPTGLAGGTVGQLEGANVVVRDSEPTAMRQGTYVAHLPHNVATTFFIPGSLVPDEGGELWIGVLPNWYADYATGYTCGFRWPWMDGQGNSAQAYISALTMTYTWQSYDTAAGEWGSATADSVSGAWWEGNLPWDVSANATAGNWGLDGESLYLEVAAGSQETLSAVMYGVSEAVLSESEAEEDGGAGEPWTLRPGVQMRSRFRVTTAGATGEAGSRFLRFRWADGQDLITGEVRLGDGNFAEGLLVYDGDGYNTTDNYVAKAVTEGAWMWVAIDTRNPLNLKIKMWAESGPFGGGEPAKWDLVVTRLDDTDTATARDYFQIDMSVGNETGANQKVEVGFVYFCGSGQDCEWVYEYLGQGDGQTFEFYTSQSFKPNSLWFFTDGLHTRGIPLDLEQGHFRTNYSVPPVADALLVARYRVDLNPEGD